MILFFFVQITRAVICTGYYHQLLFGGAGEVVAVRHLDRYKVVSGAVDKPYGYLAVFERILAGVIRLSVGDLLVCFVNIGRDKSIGDVEILFEYVLPDVLG